VLDNGLSPAESFAVVRVIDRIVEPVPRSSRERRFAASRILDSSVLAIADRYEPMFVGSLHVRCPTRARGDMPLLTMSSQQHLRVRLPLNAIRGNDRHCHT
jgi:hypothetical protein